MKVQIFKRIFTSAFLLCGLAVPNVNAASITQLYSIDVNGTLYDVTFHSEVTFNDLWDQDMDDVFGGGLSLFSTAPTFWGNASEAALARDAVIAALGIADDIVVLPGRDAFFVPYDTFSKDQDLTGDTDFAAFYDSSGAVQFDSPWEQSDISRTTIWSGNNISFATFAPATSVPEPTTLALMALGLAGIGFKRRSLKLLTNR